jgi:radical SAM superfamily enzyme YgiQ (UPF0313 family)
MKIALIAMSGVRACDEDLLELGLTLPGFVERSKTIASLPSLGLLTLAGMTPERHQVTYIEVDDIHQQPDLPDDFDLVAISTFSAQIFEAYELASQFRKKSIPVIMGGLHVTALPEEAGEHCDAVIVGEGEPVWLSVLEDAENNCLKKVYGAFDSPFRLEDSPMPAFHLLDIDKYNRITVQTSRGCPHKCEFCASSILLTSKYKQKPVERVLAEIDAIKSIWNHPFIEFADDNSFVNKRYWKQLLPQLKERKIRWFGETDLSVADDPHILDLMRESGCAQVLIGLESPIDAGMQGIEMKTDWKHRRLPKYKEAIRRIQDHGITVNGCFIIGLDGQSKRIFEDVFNFVHPAIGENARSLISIINRQICPLMSCVRASTRSSNSSIVIPLPTGDAISSGSATRKNVWLGHNRPQRDAPAFTGSWFPNKEWPRRCVPNQRFPGSLHG